MKNLRKDLIIFDAMGVLFHFPEGDDVKYGLIPFLEKKGFVDTSQTDNLYKLYEQGTRGEMSSIDFLHKILPERIDAELIEEEYLTSDKFSLTDNFVPIIERLKEKFILGIISNDFGRWNKKLRQRF